MVWGAAAVGLIAGAFSVRRRRLEQASALHAGQARADQLAQVGLKTLAWGTLGALGGAAATRESHLFRYFKDG